MITLVNAPSETCSVANITTATLIIDGITNPWAGAYPASDFTVSTSVDAAATSGSGITFT